MDIKCNFQQPSPSESPLVIRQFVWRQTTTDKNREEKNSSNDSSFEEKKKIIKILILFYWFFSGQQQHHPQAHHGSQPHHRIQQTMATVTNNSTTTILPPTLLNRQFFSRTGLPIEAMDGYVLIFSCPFVPKFVTFCLQNYIFQFALGVQNHNRFKVLLSFNNDSKSFSICTLYF